MGVFVGRSWVAMSIGLALASCTNTPTPTPDAGSAATDASVDAAIDASTDAPTDAGPATIGARTFGAFEPWATPISDFRETAEAEFPGRFLGGIHDLATAGDRLWIGYGDANNNLGTFVPIEFRAFTSADDPVATAFVVDGAGQGAEQDVPTRSGEEQIDRYRFFDGELWQAGIDSIDADELFTQSMTNPRSIAGNVYRLAGDAWVKRRSIRGGEHVHDVASWRGTVYAVGSGADLRSEFEAGQVFRYLWQSRDRGDSFATVQRVRHPTPRAGDTRWVHLLPTGSSLWLMGYESDFMTNVSRVANARYDGAEVTPLAMGDALGRLFALGTLPLPGGSGIVYGVDVSVMPRRHVTALVAPDGTVTPLAALRGHSVHDATLVAETGEVLFLTERGDAYPAASSPTHDATVWVASATAPGDVRAVANLVSEVAPTAVEHWRGALYLGTADGRVLRAR